MCVVCIQWERGKLTKAEARSALKELVDTETVDIDHAQGVLREMLEEADE